MGSTRRTTGVGARWRASLAVIAVLSGVVIVGQPVDVGAAAVAPLSTGSNAVGQLGDASVSTRRTKPGGVDLPGAVAIARG
ncbi:MAG: hypothetical protein ACK4V6_16875, partial [Microthrixaceae bacterium]